MVDNIFKKIKIIVKVKVQTYEIIEVEKEAILIEKDE